MIKSETYIRVLYAHTDKMNIVNNARYLEYFEAGRNELLRSIDFPYTELEKLNIALPVIETYCKYISAAKYDEVIKVQSYLKEKPSVKIKIFYQLFVDDKLIAEGYTVHSFVNLQKMKPVRPPEIFINVLKNYFL